MRKLRLNNYTFPIKNNGDPNRKPIHIFKVRVVNN